MGNGYNFPLNCSPNFDFDMLYNYYYRWELSIVMELIEFEGLPETIDQTFFKWCLYVTGKVTFFKDDEGNLLALNGVPSAEPNVYYIPDKVIVNNPRLKRSYDLTRDVDCVVVYCTETDKYVYYGCGGYGGVYSLLSKTATMLADNDISINVAQKNTRLHNIVSADDENTKNSIDTVFKKMYDGEPYSVVQSNFIGTLQSIPLTTTANNSYIVQLVELHQYILAHFYEALGIQTHDNMKKERLITAELDENPALLQMNINNILKSVQEGIDKVNAMFGTDITVKLNPLLMPQSDEMSESGQQSESDEMSESDQRSEPERSEPERSEPERSEPERSEPEQSEPEQSEPEQSESEQSESEQSESEQSESEQSESEQSEPEQSESGQEITINISDDATANIVITEKIEEGEENDNIPNSAADETILDGGKRDI